MAVEKITEYAAQTTGKTQTQDSRKTSNAKGTAGTSTQSGSTGAGGNVSGDSGVRYDISSRTNEVAAWYQEYLRKEQEEKLGIDPTEEEEKSKKSKKDEKDAIREELEKAEQVIKSLQRMLERMRESRKKQQEQKNKNKGKLSYSYRRVSTAISSAKTSLQANNALTSAMANVSMLRRKAASNQYDSREIEMALQHANSMVRTARKKIVNIKREQQTQRKNDSAAGQAEQRVHRVKKVPVRKKMENELKHLESELKSREKMQKNRHRREEDMELLQADLQYLKRKIDLLRNQTLSLSDGNSAVVDEIVAAATGMVSVEMQEQAVNAAEGGQTAEAAIVQSAPSTPAAPVSGGFDATV